MKNLQLLLILSLSFMIASCGGDDPLSTSIVDSSWDLVSAETTNCDDPDDNIAFTEVENSCLTFGDDTICNTILRFSADGTAELEFTEDGDLDTEEYTYTVDDTANRITLCEDPSDCYVVTVNDNELSWVSPDGDGCITNLKFEKN